MLTQEELVAKAKVLVTSKYNGDWQAAFKAYDKNGDGNIDLDELEQFLFDAKVVTRFTEWIVAKRVMDKLDPNSDGLINWNEFSSVLNLGE